MTSTLLFKNSCNVLPIVVSSWIERIPALYEYIDVEVPPNTLLSVESSVGEWTIGSIFNSKTSYDIWQDHGFICESRMGKFRNKPCASGNYTWNFIEHRFNLVYENGVVTWSYKGIPPPLQNDLDEVD
jgi:hypothetical protein